MREAEDRGREDGSGSEKRAVREGAVIMVVEGWSFSFLFFFSCRGGVWGGGSIARWLDLCVEGQLAGALCVL